MRNVWEVGGGLKYCSGLGEILQLCLFCDSIRIFFFVQKGRRWHAKTCGVAQAVKIFGAYP